MFECLDRSLQDVQWSYNFPIGDWRQVSPVVRHGSREQKEESTLKISPFGFLLILSAMKHIIVASNRPD